MKTDLDNLIDQTTAQIRAAEPDAPVLRQASDRVWAQLAQETAAAPVALFDEAAPLDSCAAVQAAIPSYLAGAVSESRGLLLADHTRECIPCRKVLTQARTGQVTARRAAAPVLTTPRKPLSQRTRWAVVAALLCTFGAGAWFVYDRFIPTGTSHATLRGAEGAVYRVNGTTTSTLNVGEELQPGESLRTASNARAQVTLADGSRVEVKDRSEFTVSETGSGATLALDKGQVLIEAAKQKSGRHLYVQTRDGLVSVAGTTFTVNSGTKGTRVSVVEGEARLNHGNAENTLHAGEQAATSEALEPSSVQDEVAWSKNAGLYIEMLAGINAARSEIAKVPRPGVRYTSRFLAVQPDDTVFYAALPNLTGSLVKSHRLMQKQVKKNAALQEFVETERNSEKGLNKFMERLQAWGRYLGPEVVISGNLNKAGNPANLLALMEINDAGGFRSFIEQQAQEINTGTKNAPQAIIVKDPANAKADDKNDNPFYIWVGDNLCAVAQNLEQLQVVSRALRSGTPSGFVKSPLYSDLSAAYKEGVGLLVAADLERVVGALTKDEKDAKKLDGYRRLGLTSLKRVLVEQKYTDGKTNSRAILNFNNASNGIPSWLAAPGPLGALNYVGPEANVVAAFSVAQPIAMVDDLLNALGTVAPDTNTELDATQKANKIDLRHDFAAALGGEFAFALDGPVLPTPSWKMVFEVNDAAALQKNIERIVDNANREAVKNRRKGAVLTSSAAEGRTLYGLKSESLGADLYYTISDGYMVVAPTRALVQRALQYRASGTNLLTSSRFRGSLPADGNPNFSALVYHDLTPLMQPLAERAQKMPNLTPEQKQLAASLNTDAQPTLAYVYATGERITIMANTDGGPFGLNPSALFGVPTSFEMQNILSGALGQKK